MEHSVQIPKLVAIIGAGISGLGAAWKFVKNPRVKVSLFEKSQTISGRIATRRKPGYFYDNGANYFSTDNNQVEELIKNHFPHDRLVEINKPIWTFEQDGIIKEGKSDYDKKKYNYKDGIKTLSKLIWTECEGKVDLQYNKRIAKMIRVKEGNDEKWKLVSTENEDLGIFDAILLTPPAPQIADILKVSSFGTEDDQKKLCELLHDCTYKSIISVVFAFDFKIEKEYFALINTDRKHNISWLSFENDKEGHVPAGETVVVVQMANHWSTEHYNEQDQEIVNKVFSELQTLFKDVNLDGKLKWGDVKKWKFALPEKALDPSAVVLAAKYNLFFAGDFIKGKGRVLDAMEQGMIAAEAIGNSFEKGLNTEKSRL